MAAPIPCAFMNASISVSSVSMSLDYRCVQTHRQGVSKPIYNLIALMCENTRMKNQAFPIDAVRESVRRLMDERGDKPKPLAATLGLSETGVRDIFLDKTKSVGGPKLAAIARYYGVTVDEIMAGTATTKGESLPIPEGAIPVTPIPMLGDVPAGPWREAVRTAHHFIPAPQPGMPPSAYALKVSGNSMDRVVHDGATIIIDPEDRDLFDKWFYVVRNEDGEVTFKQYRENPARLVPCSTDPTHQIIPVTDRHYEIVGRVVLITMHPDQAALD